MDQHNFSIQEAKQMDLAEYLELLGHTPSKVRNADYWYRSPLRDEKPAAFKIEKNLNCWFDLGLEDGGTIIDFGFKYFKCGVKEFLYRLKNSQPNFNQALLSFHRHQLKSRVNNDDKNRYKIVDVRSIKSPELVSYLRSSLNDLEIAKNLCQEVDFKLYNKCHRAIDFKNDRGGYELRNASFKGGSSPNL